MAIRKRKYSKFYLKLAGLLIILLSIPAAVFLVINGSLRFPGAQTAQTNIFLTPAVSQIPSDDGRFNVSINSGTNPVAFVRAVISFDRNVLELTNEVTVNSPLSRVVRTSSRADANNTGRIELVLALPPENRGNPPTGTFSLADLQFRSRVATSNTPTELAVQSTDVQVVHTSGVELSKSVGSASITLNPTSGTSNLVSNLTVGTNKAYQWFSLTSGSRIYIDRDFTFSTIPGEIAGATALRTANDDKTVSSATNHISFTANQGITVYVAYDERNTTITQWLNSGAGWTDAGFTLGTVGDNVTKKVVRRSFPSGSTVTLRGNGATSSANSMYSVIVRGSSNPLVINNTTVSNGKQYRWDTFRAGTLTYIDRTFTIPSNTTGIPQGAQYLRTANDDKDSVSTNWLSFDVNKSVRVYVLHDERAKDPYWLTSTFTRTNTTTNVGGGTFRIFERTFPAGRVTLGGNRHPDEATSVAKSMYTVAVVEQ